MQDIEHIDLSEVMDNAREIRLGAPALELEASDYESDLDDLDITPAQRDELLATLWSIMAGMVELGFTHDLCGQIFEGFENVTPDGDDEVELLSSEER